MKKRFFSLMVMLIGTFSAFAQDSTWGLEIKSASAETLLVALSQKPVISTSADGYVLKYGTETINYAWDELKTLRLVEGVADAIDKVEFEPEVMKPALNLQAGDAKLNGAKPNSPVFIYDLNGKMVMQTRTDADGSVTVSASTLTKGIYVIKTTTSTFKFLNK